MILESNMTGQRQHHHRFSLGSLLRKLILVCTLGLLASFFVSGEAQAHGVHAGVIVSNAADAVDDIAEENSIYATECATLCCSLISCAPALVSLPETSLGVEARTQRFARPADSHSEGFSQTSLRRPPRA